MTQFNNLPNFNVPLQTDKVTGKDWFFFWTGLFTGLPPAAVSTITVGASPFKYSPQVKGSVIVNGGTVSSIQFSRDGVTNFTTGQTAGMFTLNAADRLIVTYTVLPTMTFVPT
jgi:hypothetical protein